MIKMISVREVFLIVAAVSFFLAAIGIPSRINMVALGLLFLTLTFLF